MPSFRTRRTTSAKRYPQLINPSPFRPKNASRCVSAPWILLVVVLALVAGCASEAASEVPNTDSPAELLGIADPSSGFRLQLDDSDVAQQTIRECMLEKGFDYVPIEPPVPVFVRSNLTGRDFAAEFGYGVLTAFESVEVESYNVESANDSALELMGSAEWFAWMEAFTGLSEDAILETDALPVEGPPIGSGGCIGAAAELPSKEALRNELLARYQNQLVELESAVAGDSRYIELTEQWASCMRSQGFVVAGPGDARSPFGVLYGDLLSTIEVSPELGVTYGAEMLEKGIADEIRTATADWDCEEPLRAERMTIRDRITADYWQQNPQMLQDLSDAALAQ